MTFSIFYGNDLFDPVIFSDCFILKIKVIWGCIFMWMISGFRVVEPSIRIDILSLFRLNSIRIILLKRQQLRSHLNNITVKSFKVKILTGKRWLGSPDVPTGTPMAPHGNIFECLLQTSPWLSFVISSLFRIRQNTWVSICYC